MIKNICITKTNKQTNNNKNCYIPDIYAGKDSLTSVMFFMEVKFILMSRSNATRALSALFIALTAVRASGGMYISLILPQPFLN